MTSWRLYNLYRRAGNSPCQAFRLAQRAPVITSAVCYAASAFLAFAAALLWIWG